MIAPRKKKFIKLILMAWSVVLVITGSALPVLAASPLPTDDNGNWVPDRFYAYWLIYNTDTQSYETVNVSSSVTENGLDFVFPYNTTGVTRVSLVLATDKYNSTSNYYIDGLGLSGSAYYSNDRNTSGLVSLTSWLIVRPYYYNGSSLAALNTYNLNSNPFSLDVVYDSPTPFVGFWLTFECSIVSGTLSVHFDYISLNGKDITNKIYISDLEYSTEAFDESVEALETALPLPTFDASAFASAEAIADDYTFFNDGLRFTFMESDLVTHIFILVVYFTCLSIAIFGHSGG